MDVWCGVLWCGCVVCACCVDVWDVVCGVCVYGVGVRCVRVVWTCDVAVWCGVAALHVEGDPHMYVSPLRHSRMKSVNARVVLP